MRKWCPNFAKENGLETVLEVPVPEEMYSKMGSSILRWQNMRNLLKARSQNQDEDCKSSSCPVPFLRNDKSITLLKHTCLSLIPYQIQFGQTIMLPIENCSIETSTTKYVLQQYLGATGGYAAHNAVSNGMYAMGEVKMEISEVPDTDQDCSSNNTRSTQIGGFVLWQKNPDLWYLELVVLGCNLTAGCDGKVAWSQSSSNSDAFRCPPRPLRRFFQGLDPRSTANLFFNAVFVGEKTIKNEVCFVLRLEISKDILKSQSIPNMEIVQHIIWGFFGQRTGLLIQFTDTKLVRMKSPDRDDSIFYKTSMASVLEDYRYVDGLNIAHSGRTLSSICRYGSTSCKKWKIEEKLRIEEIDFNVCGLSMDCFLPPC